MGLGPFDSEIFPMMMVLHQWAPIATETAGKYDHVMREPYRVDSDGDGIGEPPAELYSTTDLNVPAQIESNAIEALTMKSGGDLPSTTILVSFSRGRLESLGLMEADGRPKIKKGDRWVRLENMHGSIVWTFDRPEVGGLYCEEIKLSDSFIAGASNWFMAMFKSRKKGPTV